MDLIGDPVTQRRQAALHMAGFDVGSRGLSGIDDAATQGAKLLFALRAGIDPKDEAQINAALDKKMQDPEARDRFVRIVASTPRPSRSDVAAAQWALREDGRTLPKSTDPETGLMDGIRGEETKAALIASRRREPTMSEVTRYMTPENAAWYSRAKSVIPEINTNFQNAASEGQASAKVMAKAEIAPPAQTTALSL